MTPYHACVWLFFSVFLGCQLGSKELTEPPNDDKKNQESELDSTMLELAILNYLETNFLDPDPGGKVFARYYLVGLDTDQDTLNATIWAHIVDYSPGMDGPTKNSGMSLPVILRVIRADGAFHVMTVAFPEDGEDHAQSVRSIFPIKYHDWLLGSEKYHIIALMKKELEQEATAFYRTTTEAKADKPDSMSPARTEYESRTDTLEGSRMEYAIMVPEDLPAYETAMTRYVQTGEGPDPATSFTFRTKKWIVPSTSASEPEKACAQAAADQIEIHGGPGRATIIYFKIHQDTVHIVFDVDVDGWPGSSVAIAKMRPLVEKTLLDFPDITEVVFAYAKDEEPPYNPGRD
jgi:hypothetical protein